MLFGRARELGELDQLIATAESGRGALRIVVGEAGIGKTRIADEISARASSRGFAVAWGRAWETGGAPAYWPWIELIGALVVPDIELSPRLAALLDRQGGSGAGEQTRADPGRERFELFEGVAAFLRERSRRAPLLLVIDDLHAADPASLELLCFVARGLRGARIAILGAQRDAESRLPPVADVLARIAREGDVLALPALSPEDVAEVVRHGMGHYDAALAAKVFDLTEGNPLFVREALHAATMGASGAELDRLRDAVARGGALSLVRARLEGCDPRIRGLLEAAAVIGREIATPLLADVAGCSADEVRALLESATVRGLLVRRGDDRWAFGHVLIREAFYRELPAPQRASIHVAVCAALRRRVDEGAEDHLATLAHHALAALPSGDGAEAMRTARRAAARARSMLAYEEAIALLERAIAACEVARVDERERVELELACGWACTEAGVLARGRELFRQAAQRARTIGDAHLLARAALGQGGQYVLGETRSELIDVLREALDALGESEEIESRRLRARLLARLAAALTPSDNPDETLAIAARALEMTEGETDLRVRIDVDVAAGSAFADFAPPAVRVPVNERLLEGARATGDRVLRLRALTRLACDHLERGDMVSADTAIGARAALADSLGHPRYRWQTPLIRSMRAMPEGRFDDCEAEILEARQLAVDAADPNSELCIEMHRFFMLLVAGRTGPLRAQEAAASRAVQAQLAPGAFRWVSAAADVRLGEKERAARTLRAGGVRGHLTSRMSRAAIAEAAHLAGAADVAEQHYRSFSPDEDALASFGPFAFVCSPPIARVLGSIAWMLGKPEDGRRLLTRALELTERMDAPAHRAWVHLAWAEALGTVAEARPHIDRAIELGERLAMPEIVARASAQNGERPSAAPPRVEKAPAETPRFSLTRDRSEWVVDHDGRAFRLKDVRGLAMLATLIASPEREIHALDLATSGEGAIDVGDAGEVVDAKAREAYKRRIVELQSAIEEAERDADLGRASKLRYELDALIDQLSAAVGIGGRERRAGSAAERARVTVQRRVREAIKKIAEQDPVLGRHLDWTVRTGTFCAYEPEGRRKSS